MVKQEMEMVKQEMEMGMETIANRNVKENHDFPWNFNPCKFLKMCIKLPHQELPLKCKRKP